MGPIRNIYLLSTLVTLACLSSFAGARPGSVVRAIFGDVMCTEEHPALEAGHIKLTDENYNKWKKDN